MKNSTFFFLLNASFALCLPKWKVRNQGIKCTVQKMLIVKINLLNCKRQVIYNYKSQQWFVFIISLGEHDVIEYIT